jgi:ABC-type Mn2+/Zn2+ transport system ATPase subunit
MTTLFNYGRSCAVPPIPGEAALEVSHVTFGYPGVACSALEDVSLTVTPGERVALVGPNGAGKSTLIRLIAGLAQLTEGVIKIYGNPAGSCHHRVALVPQRTEIDWQFPVTVRQVVLMGRYVHLGWMKRPRPEDHEAVDHAMGVMEIRDLADRQVGELSGGQQQRVMLARALAHEADLLLLDEPLNHVDVPTQEHIFHVLEDLSKAGRAMVISTHDLGILPIHFTRAVFLDGRVIDDGPVAEVLTAKNLARAYGTRLCTEEGEHDHMAG